MKKIKTMRIASVLLIAVLLTTSIISGTFAKYVTTGSSNDSARVAVFGVKVQGTGALFAKNYWTVGNGNGPAEGEEAPGFPNWFTVESSSEINAGNDNLVAPGTHSAGTGLNFTITGKPEVDVKITLAIDASSKDIFLGAWNDLPDMTTSDDETDTFNCTETYYPIKYTLTGSIITASFAASLNDTAKYGNVTEGKAVGTLAQIRDVLDYINDNGGGIYVDANTDLSTVGLSDITLSWEWAFENDVLDVDKKDTLLGDLIYEKKIGYFTVAPAMPAGYTEGDYYNLETSVKLTVTVTQVD